MNAKITTCCYCGTRAVLVLNRARHELACGACGAPLHKMKAIPRPRPTRHAPQPKRAAPVRYRRRPKKYDDDDRPKRRRPSFLRRSIEELWDVVEDIFD